ncbi:hypothetical protein H4R35_006234, partial [Dimargaris xerosporica]
LQYYLYHLLVTMTIPLIIGQVWTSEKFAEVLELVNQIIQFPSYTWFVKKYPGRTPNYYEFVVLYALTKKLKGFPEFAMDMQEAGTADVEFLYC